MKRDDINYRLGVLHEALVFDSELKNSIFLAFERFAINQERVYLFSELNFLKTGKPPVRAYKVSPEIELKIKKSYD